jgi:hypothetical protein
MANLQGLAVACLNALNPYRNDAQNSPDSKAFICPMEVVDLSLPRFFAFGLFGLLRLGICWLMAFAGEIALFRMKIFAFLKVWLQTDANLMSVVASLQHSSH